MSPGRSLDVFEDEGSRLVDDRDHDGGDLEVHIGEDLRIVPASRLSTLTRGKRPLVSLRTSPIIRYKSAAV